MLNEEQSELVNSHVKLAYRNAHRWQRKTYGLDFEELVSASMLGLTKAGASYSPEKGAAFKTYAIKCMTNEVIQLIRTMEKHKVTQPYSFQEERYSELREESFETHYETARHEDRHEWIDRETLQHIYKNVNEKGKHLLQQVLVHDKTFVQIAQELGCTKQNVSQIYYKLVKTGQEYHSQQSNIS